MFESEFAEAKAAHPVIELPDVTIAIFLALIRYIYADRLPPRPVRDKLVPGLLQQAQRLGMTNLSVLCQGHLASRLSVQNAIAMLDAADLYHAVPLRRAAFAFVLDNFAAVSKTLAFLQLRGDLMRHIMWRRARRRSRPSDREALTWRAVEEGLDDADRPHEIHFALSGEAFPAAAAASSSSSSSSSSSAAAVHVDMSPDPAVHRLSSALRPVVTPAGQVTDAGDSSDAAAAFAAVLTHGVQAGQHRPPKRTSEEAAPAAADSDAKRGRDAAAVSAGSSNSDSRPRVSLSDTEHPDNDEDEDAEEHDQDDDEEEDADEDNAARVRDGDEDDDQAAAEGSDVGDDDDDDASDGEDEGGAPRRRSRGRRAAMGSSALGPASARVYRARGANARNYRGHGNDDSNDSTESHTMESIVNIAQRRASVRQLQRTTAQSADTVAPPPPASSS
jgi:hypothetical protein